jgi:hypothetical protein
VATEMNTSFQYYEKTWLAKQFIPSDHGILDYYCIRRKEIKITSTSMAATKMYIISLNSEACKYKKNPKYFL